MSQLQISLKGHGPQFDGDYILDFNDDPITKREWHWFKEIADIRPGQMAEAARDGDPDLDVVFAIIAVVRAGKANKTQWRSLADFFMDSKGEMDALEVGEEDAGPPDLEIQQPSGNGSNERKPSSSEGMNGIGEGLPVTDPVFTWTAVLGAYCNVPPGDEAIGDMTLEQFDSCWWMIPEQTRTAILERR